MEEAAVLQMNVICIYTKEVSANDMPIACSNSRTLSGFLSAEKYFSAQQIIAIFNL
jgi:hypothetical protein